MTALTITPTKTATAPDGLPVPGALSVAFSSNNNHATISRLLHPDIKKILDPHPWVVKRNKDVHDPHVERGAFAMLVDESGHARALTCAYLNKDTDLTRYLPNLADSGFIEVGTSLTAINSGTGSIVISAASIKALVDTKGRNPIITEIMPQNRESMRAYRGLGYRDIKNQSLCHALHVACNAGIAAENKGNPTDWLVADAASFQTMAGVLLQAAENGIDYKRSGHIVRINIGQALTKIGLTGRELADMAQGHFPVREGHELKPAEFEPA